MEILFRDKTLAVCVKPVGVDSEKEMTELLQKELGCQRVFCVHRLDREVGGLMVYALNGKIAARLSERFAAHKVTKEYLAMAQGKLEPEQGEMRDLLFHDARKNKTFVVDRMRGGVKEAVLFYQCLKMVNELSLCRVKLETGRSHQIRVQFASRKHPLVGDLRYGSKERSPMIGLWCARLAFEHPDTHKMLDFEVLPPQQKPWQDSTWIDNQRELQGRTES